MKELKFNKEMQRSIDEGRKTQARWVIKGLKNPNDWDFNTPLYEEGIIEDDFEFFNLINEEFKEIYCPFGKIGDINNGVRITDVRVERLQEISEEDAISEGVEKYGPFGEFKGEPHPSGGAMRFRAYDKASRAFQDIWQSIYKDHPKKDWNINPWVWVITFEKVK